MSPKFCPYCGNPVKETDKFCIICGKPMLTDIPKPQRKPEIKEIKKEKEKEILEKKLSQEENKQIFHQLVESPILEAIAEKDWNKVATILNRIMNTEKSAEDVMTYFEAR